MGFNSAFKWLRSNESASNFVSIFLRMKQVLESNIRYLAYTLCVNIIFTTLILGTVTLNLQYKSFYNLMYVGLSSQTGTFNFTVIKRDTSMAVLHAVVSGKCVLFLIGGAHVAIQSRDR